MKMELYNKFSLVAAVILCMLVLFIVEHQCNDDQGLQGKSHPRGLGKKSTKSLLASVFSVPKHKHKKVQTNNVNARSGVSNTPSYYDTCEQHNKRCFPNTESHCFRQKNCTYLVIWELLPKSNYIEFTVITNYLNDKTDGLPCSQKPVKNSPRYLALGFSGRATKTSGQLAVIECSINQTETGNLGTNDAKVRLGWSTKNEFKRWDYLCSESTSIGKLIRCTVSIHNQRMMCHFQIRNRIVLNHEIFNFENSQLYLHLTSGCNIADIRRSFIEGGKYESSDLIVHFRPSGEKVVVSFRSGFALWHGVLMSLAWFVLIPNGMFVSRYFKESFVDVSIFKYRLWYAQLKDLISMKGHTAIMISAFLITIGALGVILQERAEVDFAWPAEKSTLVHYHLGFATSLALLGQMTIGWIRCHGRKLRRSFGTIHLIIGATCYILALVCIGLSYSVGMPCNISSYSLATGLWTLLCHVAMTVHFYFVDKQLGLLYYRAFYPFPISPVTYDELPGSKIRLVIFTIHFTGNVMIATVMLFEYVATGKCKQVE